MVTQQAPIGSGFNRDSTAEEVLGGADLTGKTVIITGGASGIGLETTRVLSRAGAHVIVAVRSPESARKALAGLEGVEVEQLELPDPAVLESPPAACPAWETPAPSHRSGASRCRSTG